MSVESYVYRLYFWFGDVPDGLQESPWWFQDFPTPSIREKFFRQTKRFLHAWARAEGRLLWMARPSPTEVVYWEDMIL